MKSFRALLLTKCQEEFEKDKKDDEELDKLKQAVEEARTVRRDCVLGGGGELNFRQGMREEIQFTKDTGKTVCADAEIWHCMSSAPHNEYG